MKSNILRRAVLIIYTVIVLVSGCENYNTEEEQAIRIYLWNTELMNEYAPYLQKKLPDIELEFVVGNNDLNFYEFLEENKALPDIITNRRFSLNDANKLSKKLMDLSETEAAGSIYMTYLSSFQNNDGSINWLPVCGVADGIIANTELFARYNIPLPTDYDSFVAACRAFEKKGIRGFVSDFAYDYTCMEVLQGISIAELNSLEGQRWRLQYEDPENDENGLDTVIWPGAFERMEKFIDDAGLKPEDITLDYNDICKLFEEEKAAMFRGTGDDVKKYYLNGIDTVFLPYFSDGEGWILTYPSFHVALSAELEHDPERKKAAMRVLEVMLSEEGQNMLSQKRDTVSYSKNVKMELSDKLSSLNPFIESNHLYIRLASEAFFDTSKTVVQRMLTGEYNAKQAYEAFDTLLEQSAKSKEETAAVFERAYSYGFSSGGNPAASAVANTLREYYNTDILISPAYNFTGPIFEGKYSKRMLQYMIMPNSCEAFIRTMTGGEVRELLRLSVEGVPDSFAPFNRMSLPVVSGAFIEVSENNERSYSLEEVRAGGKRLEDTQLYTVAYLNPVSWYTRIAPLIYPEQGDDAFKKQDMMVRNAWAKYIAEGNSLMEPTDYILLK